MSDSNTGYLLNNRYRLIDQIGEGGMANVYLGQDTILNRKVAIKVLRGDLSNDEVFVKRFQREALAATALEHPNLVQVYDVGEEKGYHYIVMEYIEGKTLKQLIKQHGPLSVAETIDVMEQLVSAVEHAHSRQVIHRDIKPQNVIVRNDGTVKLTDFGIAVAQNAAQLTQTNSIMGSVHYLAPELAKGQQASVQSDIYSLGILMFELLSGEVPFAGDSAVNIALMHMEDKIPSIKQIVGPDVNQAIENIIIKATAKNKNYRYHSAHDMLIDLIDCQYRNNEAIYEIENDGLENIEDNDSSTIIVDKDEIEQAKSKKKSKKKLMIILGSVVGAIIIALALFFVFTNNKKDVIEMPDILNVTKEEAVNKLDAVKINAENGYTINFEDEESDSIEKGLVISSDPEAGNDVLKDQTITIKISSGAFAQIPSVVGEYVDSAKQTLENAGFKVNAIAQESSEKEYLVLSVDPGVGTKVEKGSTVTIKYAIKEKVTMLDVTNLTYISAFSKLQGLGLLPKTTNCTENDIVSRQSIGAGKSVEPNTSVTLTCKVKQPETKPDENGEASN